MWLFATLVAVPIIEIALFIKVGGLIGLWPTLAIVVGTALAGTALMRSQGREAMARLQRSLEQGGNPAGPIAHGAMILVAGVLLLTPGFFTDALGLALLLPPVRSLLIVWGAAKLAAGVRDGRVKVFTAGRYSAGPGAGPAGRGGPSAPRGGGDVIEGEYMDADASSADEGAPKTGPEPGAETGPKPGKPGGSGWTQP